MANIKFSDFTANAAIVQADHFLVGYDDDGAAGGANPKNNRWTFSQVAAGLAAVTATPYSLYASDGILAATERKIGIPSSGVLKIQNADGTPVDLLTIKEDSSITIGEGAAHSNAAGGPTSVVIGASAATNGSNGMVAIGGSASAGNGQSTCIGYNSTTSNPYVTNLGAFTQNAADYGVSLGFGSRGSGAYNVQLGYQARGTGANSINITSCGSTVAPSTANAFGVYMTSNTTPNLEVVGGDGGFLRLENPTAGYGFLKIYPNSNGAPFGNNIAFQNGSTAGDDTFIQVRANSNTMTLAGTLGNTPRSVTINPSIAPSGALTAALEVKGFRGSGHLTHGILVAAGTDTNADYALTTTNKTGDELFSVAGDGVAKYTGQAYTELHTGVSNATVDWNNGNVQEITLASSTTNVFTPTNAKAGATYILKVIQGGTSGLVTWESSGTVVNWSGGTPPTLTATSAAVDIVTLICTAGGATGGTFYANAVLNFS